VEPNPYGFRTLVGQRSNIHIFSIATPFYQLYGQLTQFTKGIRKFYFEQMATIKQSFIVVLNSEETKSFLLTIPVAADAIKTGCAIVKGMG